MSDDTSASQPHSSDSAGTSPEAPSHEKRTALTPLGAVSASALVLVTALGSSGLLAMSRRTPPTKPFVEAKTGVEVTQIGPAHVVPRIEGFGRARPTRRVTLSAEVGGRVAWIHPELESGHRLPQGASVVAIDSADATATLAQAEAQLASAEAEVQRLVTTGEWVRGRLKLAEDALRLELADLARAKDLKARGIDSERGLDQAQRAVVGARDALLTLQQSEGLLVPQLAAAQARILETRSRRDRATRDLERCQIVLPFAGLIAETAVEAHQQITPGQTLFELWEVKRLEVPVSISLGDALLISDRLDSTPTMGSVEVRYELPGLIKRWPGRVLRFEPLQAETQTLRAVVEVRAEAGLVPDAFCHVSLEGRPLKMALALPTLALQEGGRVFLAETDAEGVERLAIRSVRTGRRSGAWVEVLAGLEPGARVVVSPVERAIEGMPLITSTPTKGVTK